MSYLRNKKAQWLLFLIVLIVVPIVFHYVEGVISGINAQKAARMPVTVQTISPVVQDYYYEVESAGRLDSKYTVDVLARINGWLQKRFFDEGAKIKKGQTLFLIEPDEYQIAVNTASANVRQTHAALVNAEKELVRADELVKKDYVSKSYYDQALATRDSSRAAYDAAKAQLSNAQLNLSYTKVTSPIDGKIGKIIITEGNLVNTQSGPLARIVSVHPIFAYFTLKSSEFLKFKRAGAGEDFSNMEVTLQLADGSIYPEVGQIEFVDNQVNETTGTISLRATFENADELLVPGDFVQVKVKATEPRNVMLIPQTAVLDDSQGFYVWAIDEENKAQRRDIKVSDEINKNWVVEEGLNDGDVIVGKGIQSIRVPGQVVKPVPMEETSQETQQIEAK